MQTDLIIVSEYCRICHIEPSFLYTLEKGGLIKIDIIEGESYLPVSQLYDVERYTRLYYDLSINVEGIDAIHHLLERIKSMQKEIDLLKNQLRLYENDQIDIDEL
ncbi:chaperone modulator CbpM [Parabacteroides sp. APC149_11_2_Y6]|jgi:hypothetical protein